MKNAKLERRTFLAAGAATLTVPGLAAPAVGQPAKTATLKFVPQANLTLLDPIITTALVTTNHAHYVFDTLYSAAADGIPKPQMASGAEVSADGRTWKIGLRDGLKFHDGTPVLARDCAASIARWAKREPYGQLLDKVVDSYGAADDKTVEIKLKKPFPLLLNAIGKPDSSLAFIMPERLAQTDPGKQVTEMIGSGPYKFVASEFSTGNRVVYEKNEAYVPRSEPPVWATGAKVAHFPRIEWRIIPDPATAAAALQSGEVDWWEQPLADLRRNTDPGVSDLEPQPRSVRGQLCEANPDQHLAGLRELHGVAGQVHQNLAEAASVAHQDRGKAWVDDAAKA